MQGKQEMGGGGGKQEAGWEGGEEEEHEKINQVTE